MLPFDLALTAPCFAVMAMASLAWLVSLRVVMAVRIVVPRVPSRVRER